MNSETRDPGDGSIREAVAGMREARASAVAMIEAAREQALRHADLNAIAWVDWDLARSTAAERDREARAGRLRGPLHGMPISIKDLYRVRDTVMQAGTHAELPDTGRDEALAVERLRAAGAVIFAKTNLHEVALGATGENGWTGDVKNPFDPARQSGGSSSGAGVCVAKRIGVAGLGSDTGGSIRIPANFCGVVGFKPSFGAVPLDGALNLSWTFDHAGPLTRSVDDAAVVFEALSQRSTGHGRMPRKPTLAVPAAWLAPRLSEAVREVFERSLVRLRAHGAQIVELDMPGLMLAWNCYTPIVRAEAAHVHRQALAKGGQGFSEAVLNALLDGRKINAGQYLDALRIRRDICGEFTAITRDHDAIILPTAPVLPPLRGQTEVATASGAMLTRLAILGQTLPFNVAGLPALTVPMGFVGGLPTGLQIVGARDGDASLLALGRWCESLLGAQPPAAA